ncbi:MAG: hypothetical protein H7A23_03445 [Leptospiraceae bacterium]|nr:hypothetical protein [Leptospiraceae bacterium]
MSLPKKTGFGKKTIFTSCKAALFGVTVAEALGDKVFQDFIILTCLLDYSVKYSCRNKSNTKPIIGENDWGRTSEE